VISFQPPSLDDRRFDDLVEEMIRRVPAHTPEWTNPRLGDPGRTLIELFAWLGDALLYRANLIPERQRLVFLKLLGLPLKPAQPARTIVSLGWAQPTILSAATLAAGARIAGASPFETLSETTILPISAEAYIKRALSDDESTRMAEVIDGLTSVHGITSVAKGYETTPIFSGAVPDGLDVFADSADRALWLALLAPLAPRAEDQPATNTAARAAMGGGDSGAASLLSVGVVPALSTPALFEEIGSRARVPVLWEITTRGTTEHETAYLTLEPLAGTDTTGGLARAGTMRLPLPDESLIWAPRNDVAINTQAGVGDAPPRLDDLEKDARLVGWLRLRPAPGQEVRHLPLAWIGVNAVEVDQRNTHAGRVLGTSTGIADQFFNLPQSSADGATLNIEVEEPGRGYQPWQRVEDLGAIHPDPQVAREARVYELDAAAGVIRFGDGVRGRIPEREMRVRLARGRFGGGRGGNVAGGTLTELSGARDILGNPAPAIKVVQPLAAEGGEDAETLAQAEQRIPSYLRHRDRAVTPEDYRSLVFETPGVSVGRVEVMPRFKPRDRRFNVPGVVSVMALPAQPLSRAPNPRPDRPFIERVHAHLSARAPLATELYVIGCEYLPLGVSVAVAIRDGHARDITLHEVKQALMRLLWPLAPGGAEAKGWPLGRSVKTRELEVEVSRVPGVREVTGLLIFSPEGGGWRRLPKSGNDGSQTLTLAAWQLPELLSVVVIDDPDGTKGAPTELLAAPNPYADPNAVAVPVVPELC
jgi:predicted phage baseplate assembly protein